MLGDEHALPGDESLELSPGTQLGLLHMQKACKFFGH